MACHATDFVCHSDRISCFSGQEMASFTADTSSVHDAGAWLCFFTGDTHIQIALVGMSLEMAGRARGRNGFEHCFSFMNDFGMAIQAFHFMNGNMRDVHEFSIIEFSESFCFVMAGIAAFLKDIAIAFDDMGMAPAALHSESFYIFMVE